MDGEYRGCLLKQLQKQADHTGVSGESETLGFVSLLLVGSGVSYPKLLVHCCRPERVSYLSKPKVVFLKIPHGFWKFAFKANR